MKTQKYSVRRITYPLADRDTDGWYSDGNYKDRGGVLVWLAPSDFLSRVRPLKIDKESREQINILKQHIVDGKPLDPLKIYENGKEDGRHRAHASLELDIIIIPAIIFGE